MQEYVSNNPVCGPVNFEYYYENIDASTLPITDLSSELYGVLTIAADTSLLVYTSDQSLLGDYIVKVKPLLLYYPSITTPSMLDMTLHFTTCPVQSVKKSSIDPVQLEPIGIP